MVANWNGSDLRRAAEVPKRWGAAPTMQLPDGPLQLIHLLEKDRSKMCFMNGTSDLSRMKHNWGRLVGDRRFDSVGVGRHGDRASITYGVPKEKIGCWQHLNVDVDSTEKRTWRRQRQVGNGRPFTTWLVVDGQ